MGGTNSCEDHIDLVLHGTLDFAGNNGVVDSADFAIFGSLIGTECGQYNGGSKYNPVVDFNRDGVIDGTDLALFTAHFGHHCSEWQPSSGDANLTDLVDYPWEVFELPQMQAAMQAAGVDRKFIEAIWRLNGREQNLFVRGEAYNPVAHMAEVIAREALYNKPQVRRESWGLLKNLYR